MQLHGDQLNTGEIKHNEYEKYLDSTSIRMKISSSEGIANLGGVAEKYWTQIKRTY